MPTHKPVSVSRLFSGGALPELLEHGRVLARLNRVLSRALPAPLDAHCRVLNLRHHTLTLAVDDPLWASRLRYQTRTLLQQLAAVESVTVRTIQIRIQPQATPRQEKSRRNKPLSASNARLVRQTARSLKDERLRAALLRVASRGEKT
jgi:hypothetical protein